MSTKQEANRLSSLVSHIILQNFWRSWYKQYEEKIAFQTYNAYIDVIF